MDLAGDLSTNGHYLYNPNAETPSGTGTLEYWDVDKFEREPYADVSMVQTAENVARKYQIDTARQHEVVLRRYQQYKDACADGHKFLRRFMSLPFAVPDAKFRKTRATLEGDHGTHHTTAYGLAKLKPVVDGGTVTFGVQTHPARGNTAGGGTPEAKTPGLS